MSSASQASIRSLSNRASTTLSDPANADNLTGVDDMAVPQSLTAELRHIESIPSTSALPHVAQSGSTTAKRDTSDGVDREDEEGQADESAEEEEEEETDEDEMDQDGEAISHDQEPPETFDKGEPDEPPERIAEARASSSEAEDSDGTDEEDDDEDEDEEPTLKYARLGGETIDILSKDSASALAVSTKYIVMGTHMGAIFILDFSGKVVARYRPHTAMINAISIDGGSEFVASASMDGKVAVQSLTTSEHYVFDLKRPMRSVTLEPNFGKRSTRQLVSGGMAGSLILHEKGWLGHKEVVLHSGEGPIWATEWRGTLIAWANDAGVRIYDTSSGQRITFISRAADSPRADLFKCTMHWQDDHTLLIAWADFIKVATVKEREGRRGQLGVGPHQTELYVEVTAIFQVDCMISGIAPHEGSYLILAYLTEDLYSNEATENRDEQRRKAASRPELRVISRDGEELSSDAISLRNFARFQCRDYSLCPAPTGDSFYVISPEDIVVARPRDEEDHVEWLIETRRYDKALLALEELGLKGRATSFDVAEVGKRYLEYLVDEGQFDKAAELCPKILGINAKLWEDWVFLFADKGQIGAVIPFVPTHDPQLSRLVYEMILAHFLRHDHGALLHTIRSWPHDIYDTGAVILAVQGQIDRKSDSATLIEAIAELYILNRQPGKALPHYLKLRRADVFDLIRDYNLFTDIQDQALHLIEFDEELQEQRKDVASKGQKGTGTGTEEHKSKHGTAVELLVDHTHSIPIPRVVAQLQSRRRYLFMYLDALFDKDPHLAFDYSDLQVDLYAEYDPNKLMDFLRASNYYSLERAFKICDARDLVPEMVFLLGRMGDNKRALNLIIERLGDVQRAIDFAKEQNDKDLWEDLLTYSETKPRFIRGLLDNVGPEIDPIRIIRRIRNGLEIPGLKAALIKVLQDYNLQVSLMEGCKTILDSDCRNLALTLHDGQTNGFLWTGETSDESGTGPVFPHLAGDLGLPATLPFGVHYLCSHSYSSATLFPDLELPASVTSRDNMLAAALLSQSDDEHASAARAQAMSAKFRFLADLKARGTAGSTGRGKRGVEGADGCPECRKAVRV